MKMTDDQFTEIEKAVAALVIELMKYKEVRFLWGHSPYKELKWVQHNPVLFGIECALRHIGKRLTKMQRLKIRIKMAEQPDACVRLMRLWEDA